MGKVIKAPQFVQSRGGVSVDPKLEDILTTAAEASGLDVTFFSGVSGRSSGTKNHPGGHAIDIELSDSATGQTYSSYAGGAFSRGVSWKQSFPVYEQFAQTARIIQEQKYPELNDTFAWGGYWYAGSGNKSGPDMMHFQVTPGAGRMTTLRAGIGGSWQDGASEPFQKTYGITSNGGLRGPAGAQLATQVMGALSGGAAIAPFGTLRPTGSGTIDGTTIYTPRLDANGDYVPSPNKLRQADYPADVTTDPIAAYRFSSAPPR